MKFSIIMASRLIPYHGCASQLDKKLVRSVTSALDQKFTDFELIVIADGCNLTKEIIRSEFKDERIKLLECKHKSLFDNLPRNTGIDHASGEYITYLDVDDYIGEDHLAIINHNLADHLWVWYNDYTYQGEWMQRACNIKSMGGCGTSNITYKRSLDLKWGRPGYAHDYHFIQQLLKQKGTKIETPEYFVCHIPGDYDK